MEKRDGKNAGLPETDAVYALLAETFKVLGDATRVRILHVLSHGERGVGELTELLGMSQSAVSHQLRLLRVMRLVRNRRDGRSVFYSLDDEHIDSLLRDGLEHVREALD